MRLLSFVIILAIHISTGFIHVVQKVMRMSAGRMPEFDIQLE